MRAVKYNFVLRSSKLKILNGATLEAVHSLFKCKNKSLRAWFKKIVSEARFYIDCTVDVLTDENKRLFKKNKTSQRCIFYFFYNRVLFLFGVQKTDKIRVWIAKEKKNFVHLQTSIHQDLKYPPPFLIFQNEVRSITQMYHSV